MREGRKIRSLFLSTVILAAAAILVSPAATHAQSSRDLTPLQFEIEKQDQRLKSGDEEERRDALMRLGAIHRAAASRVALPLLSDPSPAVRVAATKAILSLDSEESAAALLPLLNDKDEFVRRETAYALGLTRSRTATTSLTDHLLNDKEAGVRGAAAVALGRIGDENAVVALVSVLAPQLSAPAKSKRKPEANEFVLRAAAVALGELKNKAGTPALIAALNNEKFPQDVRREAARSLGLIGDPAAIPALKFASTSEDPFLSELAFQALRKLSR
ncbi:MAG TPA: HEAT repeat domain-containing protein [Pyrinomonadaceae bacterium]